MSSESEGAEGPAGERWGRGAFLTVAVWGVVIVLTLIQGFLEQPGWTALTVMSALFVVFGYESKLLPHFFWEVRRRV